MNMLLRLACLSLVLALVGMLPAFAQNRPADPQNTLFLETKDGRVVIRLREDLAPHHVERLKILARKGFYDGVVFHRVIAGFMAQTGDPTGTGTGKSDLPDLAAEFSQVPYKRGTLGMARAASPNSANSQFFLCYEGCGSLTGQYTIVGEVVSGMEFVDKIKKGDPLANGLVNNPDKIIRMQVAADTK
jgi:cyclophilin family peptidyl-prolyl cis-trans isomerase